MKYIGIFQGGGVKAIAHVGAIKALEERGFFCVKAAGTSAGAIIASLVVAGYNADELIEFFQTLDITTLKEKGKAMRIIKDFGIYSSSPLEKYLEGLYKKKGISTYLDVKNGRDYNLKVIATDIIKRKQVTFPNDLVKYDINPVVFLYQKALL